MDVFDIRTLNPLQVFLLVLVEFGIDTPYELLTKAGLGSGLTSPALKRLKDTGFLTSTPGPRNRVQYAITEKGKESVKDHLNAGPEPFWQQGPSDVFESLPRGIILVWLHGGPDAARSEVGVAVYKLSNLSNKREREAEELRGALSRLKGAILAQEADAAKGVLIATTYQWLKAESEAKLFRLQAAATGELGKLLTDLPQASPIQ